MRPPLSARVLLTGGLVALAVLAALPGCDAMEPAPTPEAALSEHPIIYGADDRRDLYEVSDAILHRIADSTVILMDPSLVSSTDDGYAIDAFAYGTYGAYFSLCSSERFRDQPTPGWCSGFQVGEDLIATAGHCVESSSCGDAAFVFGFAMHTDATTYPTKVGPDDVYFCSEVLAQVDTDTLDYAVVRLDRPIAGGVAGRAPLPIRRSADGLPEADARVTGMVSVSYPSGIPLKIKGGPDPIPGLSIGGVNIKASATHYFEVGADVAAGSSGSPLVSFDTDGDLLFVEGLLARGNRDMRRTGSCWVTVVCSYDDGCSGANGGGWEEYNRTTTFDAHVPITDCHATPEGCHDEVGAPGEGCWDSGDTRAGGAIAFDCGPASAPRGSLHLFTREDHNADKATLDRRIWAAGDGCDAPPIGDRLSAVTDLAYTWHVAHDGTFSFAAPALKLLLDSPDANGTNADFLETVGDKILVYEPYLQLGAMMVEDAWIDEAIAQGEGRWWLVDLTPGGSPGLGPIAREDLRTLAEWSEAFAGAGLGDPVIASVQLGVGSYNPGLVTWVDRFIYESTATRVVVDFVDPEGACDPSGDEAFSTLLKSTASFLDRGVGTGTADLGVRLPASEVEGASEAAKNATLLHLAETLEAITSDVERAISQGSSVSPAAMLERRLNLLRGAATGAAEPLLTGTAAAAFDRMLDRALEAPPE